MRYTIRHFDLPLLTFEANMDSADTNLHIIKVYEENRSFLPLNLTVSEDGVERWLRHRTIPSHNSEESSVCRCSALQGGAFLESSAGNYHRLQRTFAQ